MTWDIKDLAQRVRDAATPSPLSRQETSQTSEATPFVLDSAGVPMLPTVAAGLSWDADDDMPRRLPQDVERDLLMVDGFVSEREWQLWARICRRGIVEK